MSLSKEYQRPDYKAPIVQATIHCHAFFKTNIPICFTDVSRMLRTTQAVTTERMSWVVIFGIVKTEILAQYFPYSESLKLPKGAKVSLEIDPWN